MVGEGGKHQDFRSADSGPPGCTTRQRCTMIYPGVDAQMSSPLHRHKSETPDPVGRSRQPVAHQTLIVCRYPASCTTYPGKPTRGASIGTCLRMRTRWSSPRYSREPRVLKEYSLRTKFLQSLPSSHPTRPHPNHHLPWIPGPCAALVIPQDLASASFSLSQSPERSHPPCASVTIYLVVEHPDAQVWPL